MTSLTDLVVQVQALRRLSAEQQAHLRQRYEEYVAVNAVAIESERITAKALTVAEAQLKGAAEAHYRATGEVNPAPGVKIKMKTVLSYDWVTVTQEPTATLATDLDKALAEVPHE